MSKKYDWMTALQRNDDILNRLSGATTAISLIADSTAWVRLNQMDQKLFSAADSALVQLSKIENLCSPAMLSNQTSALGLLGTTLSMGYVAAAKLAVKPTILDGIAQMSSVATAVSPGMFAAADQVAKILQLYQFPSIVSHMDTALSQLGSFDKSIFEAAQTYDFSGIEVRDDGVITFEGVEYGTEEITAELTAQIEIAKKPTLREKFESFQQRIWLLLLVLNIIMFLPQVPETVDFYCDTVAQIQELYEERSHICFTIKERSILREEASSTAARILYLPYDTPLEIIADIPRWYQVKYTKEDGTEVIGWISKISVETEG